MVFDPRKLDVEERSFFFFFMGRDNACVCTTFAQWKPVMSETCARFAVIYTVKFAWDDVSIKAASIVLYEGGR